MAQPAWLVGIGIGHMFADLQLDPTDNLSSSAPMMLLGVGRLHPLSIGVLWRYQLTFVGGHDWKRDGVLGVLADTTIRFSPQPWFLGMGPVLVGAWVDGEIRNRREARDVTRLLVGPKVEFGLMFDRLDVAAEAALAFAPGAEHSFCFALSLHIYQRL